MEVSRLPPAPKRPRLSQPSSALEMAAGQRPARAEFPCSSLEDFYVACPSYRLPLEVGAFSIDVGGRFHSDRSELRYYSPPGRMNLDLRVGYREFVPKSKQNVPENGLLPILQWISSNGDCFRPKGGPKSPEKNGETAPSELLMDPPHPRDTRPEDLLTNFVTWRGMLTKMLCSPYNKTEPWMMAATLHHGTIYLSELETAEARERTARQSDLAKEMCYWGLKFEDYMTTKEPLNSSNSMSRSSTGSASTSRLGTVNAYAAFCSVVRTRMVTHSIVMAGEVDCCDQMSKDKPPQNYMELKTSRIIFTDRNQASFKRHKLMKWWAQSFLIGVPKIVCGFRNDDGVVRNLQAFKTTDIPRETQKDLRLWQPAVCLNFLNQLLTWLRKTVVKDDPRVVYVVEWNAPYTHVTCTEYPPNSEQVFLPDWYIQRLRPPQD